MSNLEDARSREELRATWNRAVGSYTVRDPVLRKAIKNPRIATPYGSEPGDYGWSGVVVA